MKQSLEVEFKSKLDLIDDELYDDQQVKKKEMKDEINKKIRKIGEEYESKLEREKK